tara:strand:+ start:1180 stop:1464 length:285 start_codon:yes stop_codon:yes gene_type:complete
MANGVWLKDILVFEDEYSPMLDKTYSWSWHPTKQDHQFYETWLPKKTDIVFHTKLSREEKATLREELFNAMADEFVQARELINHKRRTSRAIKK